jgi:hypothetical protein
MKKIMTIFGAIIFASIILIGCGGNSTSTSVSTEKTTGLIGKRFITEQERFYSLTFINENEVVYGFPDNDGDVNCFIYKYTLKDNVITVDRNEKGKYVLEIYNESIIINRWDSAEWEGKLRCTTFIRQ